MFYFKSRAEAGRKLAKKLAHKKYKRPVVFCLSEGATVVGAQIAMTLHADMVLYKIKDIFLPNEIEATAALSSTGTFRYNDLLSPGEIEEIIGEYHNYMDEQRMQKFHELNVLLGDEGEIERSILHHRDIIVVADALRSGFAVAMAADYLKTVAIRKFYAAAAVVSVSAVDQLHVLSDEFQVLGVTENFIDTNHYFDDPAVPTTEQALKIINNINYAWRSGLGDEIKRLQGELEKGKKRRFELLKHMRERRKRTVGTEKRGVFEQIRRRGPSRRLHHRLGLMHRTRRRSDKH